MQLPSGLIAGLVGAGAAVLFAKLWQRMRLRSRMATLDNLKRLEAQIVCAPVGYLDKLPDLKDNEAKTLYEKGLLHCKDGKHQEALAAFGRLFTKEVTPSQMAALHILIGNEHYRTGNLGAALGHYYDALARADAIDDRQARSAAIGNIGLIHAHKGELDQALKRYQEALAIRREIEYRQGEASNLGYPPFIHGDKGPLDLDLEQQARAIHRLTGYPHAEATDLENISFIYGHKGNLQQLLEHHH